jgi:hypothetical protein
MEYIVYVKDYCHFNPFADEKPSRRSPKVSWLMSQRDTPKRVKRA